LLAYTNKNSKMNNFWIYKHSIQSYTFKPLDFDEDLDNIICYNYTGDKLDEEWCTALLHGTC
jgi:hypothetical protein